MIWFGGDYNPEQWDPPTWAEDDKLMREAHVNTATVGVFSWSILEPEEGRYEFGWLDDTLDRLHANGVRVILATPTASPPPWFTLAHPDAMPVTREGIRLWHGSRDTYCAAAPAYRQAALRIATELASRYAGHPALALWHVHNEYGTICWCDHAAIAFRRWLRRRYGDSLDALNTAWGTAFWSQRYSAWQQVLPPRATQYLPNPSQQLDYSRFWSDELLAAFTEQRDAIRRHTPGVPVTTNFMLPDYQVLDPWAWSREMDVFSTDHYLSSVGPEARIDIAFAADRARSFKSGQPWLLMEQAASTVTASDGTDHAVIAHREPGRTLSDSLAYIARGSDSALFFQWRASRAGAEMFHAALVPHAGRDSRIFTETTELGAALELIAEVTGSVVRADAAILWDPDSWWALGTRKLQPAEVHYPDRVRAAHAALWRVGIVTDFAHPESDLTAYRLVLAPAVYLVSAEAARALRRYVEGGGHLVVTFLSGIADANNHVRLGGYPGALRDLLGIRIEEFHPLPDGVTAPLSTGDNGTVWSERLRTEGAQAVASYTAGPLAGLPAITRNTLGKGTAWYLSTHLADNAHDRFLAEAAAAAEVVPVLPDAPPGIEAIRRHGTAGASWLFVFNHSDSPVAIRASGLELLSGRTATGGLELGPRQVAVVREDGSLRLRGSLRSV
jgi:beta-galactosidase